MASTDEKNGFLGSAPNVTTLVTTLVLIFVVVIFAVVTQLLAASGAISLSTTLQLTMWLVALGFVVLLAIAYMFFRAFERIYETPANPQLDPEYTGPLSAPPLEPGANGQGDDTYETQDPAPQKRNGAQDGAQPGPDAGSPRNPVDGSRQFIPGWAPGGSAPKPEDTWVPPDGLRHLEGSGYSVSTKQVFPHGCYLVPESIAPVSDELTGQQVYECRVVDRNPALEDRPHEAVVKILASQRPSLTSMPRYGRVEFENLTITPYVTDQGPMHVRYLLRATGLYPAAAPTGREPAVWTVPPPRNVPPDETQAPVSTGDEPGGAAGTS
jgi:hypothetical protein